MSNQGLQESRTYILWVVGTREPTDEKESYNKLAHKTKEKKHTNNTPHKSQTLETVLPCETVVMVGVSPRLTSPPVWQVGSRTT